MAKVSSPTIKEALSRLKKGLLSAQELCAKCHQRMTTTRKLNVYITEISQDAMLAQAKESQNFINKGCPRALEAIPIGFKDNFCTNGIATTCASRMLQNYVPLYNATMVSKCLENGAVLAGKLNMDEYAMGSSSLDSCYGPVKNPWSLVVSQSLPSDTDGPTLRDTGERTGASGLDSQSVDEEDDWLIAGGSSGGSAAAVASGSCLAAFGSDTGGSTRIPAGYCGVVGFKPTYGLLSRHGLIPLVNSLDCPGIFTKTVEDCAIVLNAVAGHDLKDSTSVYDNHTPFKVDPGMDLTGMHIGIPKEFYVEPLSGEVVSLWRDTADILESAGARVSQVSLPHSQQSLYCYSVLNFCEVASNFTRYDGIEFGLRKGSEESTEELYAASRDYGFNEEVRGRILFGNYFLLESNYEKYFVKAQRVRRLIANDVIKVFDSGVNMLLTPVTLNDAPWMTWYMSESHSARREEVDMFCAMANLAGIPAVSVPLRISQKGLPLNLQLIGRAFGESQLLSVAHWLEQMAGCPRLSLDFLDNESDVNVLR